MKIKYILFILLFINTLSIKAQDKKQKVIDSLVNLLQTTTDSAKVDVLNELAWKLRNSEPRRAVVYGEIAIELSKHLKYYKGLAQAYSFVGVAYRNLGNYPEAFDKYYKGLEFSKKIKNAEYMGYSYINLGNLYIYQQKYQEALENLQNAIQIADSLQNIRMQGYAYLNLGRAELRLRKFNEAETHLQKSLEMRKKQKDENGMAVCLKDLGDNQFEQKRYKKALELYQTALPFAQNSNDNDLISDILDMTAKTFLNQEDLINAEKIANSSLLMASKVNSKLRIRNAYQTLSEIHYRNGELAQAYKNQQQVIHYNDSLYNQELSEKIANIQFSAIQQKKQAEIDILNRDKRIQELSLNRQKTITAFLIGILLLFGILLILVFRLNIIRRKTNFTLIRKNKEIEHKNAELNQRNQEIEAQRDEIETQKNYVTKQRDEILYQKKQITDSILYAQRIQSAMFPAFDLVNQYFSQSFVYFLPRDIVSGDFYWSKKIDNKLLIAAADCTGHGVPGAFMSLLGITALNEIVNRTQNLESNQILEELRIVIKTSLRQKGASHETRDGMDIALCVINTNTNELCYSGANQPIYVFRNKNLIEFKPDKNPIGIYVKEKPFVKQLLTLEKSDIIYLFSDGYHSQFGGTNADKFKIFRFKQLLNDIHEQELSKQHEHISRTYSDWKNKQKQVDDILVIGLKV